MMIVIKYFSATWCGPCHVFKPTMKKIAQSHTVQFLDVDDDNALAEQYGVRAVPTVVIEKDGTEVHRFTGALSFEKVLDILSKI